MSRASAVRHPVPATSLLAVAALAGIVGGLSAVAPINPFDGGISPSAATFTLHGLLPYRDYWMLYGPLSGWLFAIPTAIFGPSLELVALSGLLVLVITAVAGFVVIAGRAPTPMAVLVAAASVALLGPFHGVEFSAWPLAMAFALFGLAAAERGRPILAGVLIGLAFLSRLDVGGYAALAAMLFPRRLPLIAGFVAVAGPIAGLAVLTTPLPRLFEQVIWWPLIGNRQFRNLAAPSLGGGMDEALISLVLLLLPRAVILAATGRAVVDRGPRIVVALAVFAALCQLQTLGRPDPTHFVQAATPAVLLLAFLVDPLRRVSRVVVVSVAATLLGFGLTGLVFWLAPPDRSGDLALARAAAVVREATDPGAPIYVGVTDHRYTIANPLIAYYLADRRGGTRTTMFNPGITNVAERQAEMADEVEREGVDLLILDTRFAPLPEDAEGSREPGADVLNAYIASRFEAACEFGPIVVMQRRGSQPLDCR